MGLSDKTQHQFDGELHDTSEKWVISEISLLSQMKPISLPSTAVADMEDDVHQDKWPTTPTAAAFRIPTVFPCPPPPKKRKTSSKFDYSGAREFFSPPDLKTVFIQKSTAPP
ncbi:unnamed protein product [Eruca vesicaria subsp. sativa]|uniref:Uncharacterized protein n=1 Tax=Eruca vesicaria subsp. sativa TaxID=29727 RepID=A0ABC8JZY4_ERUVS|nr:unnamed protein product [Eruca vesicaria subsp. sativa]